MTPGASGRPAPADEGAFVLLALIGALGSIYTVWSLRRRVRGAAVPPSPR